MTDINYIKNLRVPSKENPLRILMSACLTGLACGYDGTSYGDYPASARILKYDTVRISRFCPEEFSFGTPREMCDIHGGTGIDVLEGRAKVLTESGKDWTKGMINASEKMLAFAIQENVELAIMMDVSAACGSQVIYSGNRFGENKVHQIGAGVCGAQLIRNGIKVISQRDYASLEILMTKIDPGYKADAKLKDHHESDWHKEYFNTDKKL